MFNLAAAGILGFAIIMAMGKHDQTIRCTAALADLDLTALHQLRTRHHDNDGYWTTVYYMLEGRGCKTSVEVVRKLRGD